MPILIILATVGPIGLFLKDICIGKMFSLGLVFYIVTTIRMKRFSSQGQFYKMSYHTGRKCGHRNFCLREEHTSKANHRIAILKIIPILLPLFER